MHIGEYENKSEKSHYSSSQAISISRFLYNLPGIIKRIY